MAQQKTTGQRVFKIGPHPETGTLDIDAAIEKLTALAIVLDTVGGTVSFAAVRRPISDDPDEQVTVAIVGRWRSYSFSAPAPAPPPADEPDPEAIAGELLDAELPPGSPEALEAAQVLDAIEDAATGAGAPSAG